MFALRTVVAIIAFASVAYAQTTYRDQVPAPKAEAPQPVHVVIEKTPAQSAAESAAATKEASDSLSDLAATVRERQLQRENPLQSADFDTGRRVAYPTYSERPNSSFLKCTIPGTAACRAYNARTEATYLARRRGQIAMALHSIAASTNDEQWLADRIGLFESGMIAGAPADYHAALRAEVAAELERMRTK